MSPSFAPDKVKLLKASTTIIPNRAIIITLVMRSKPFCKPVEQMKSEAVREFAERLKAKKVYCVEKHETVVSSAEIDWILREMTEGEQ